VLNVLHLTSVDNGEVSIDHIKPGDVVRTLSPLCTNGAVMWGEGTLALVLAVFDEEPSAGRATQRVWLAIAGEQRWHDMPLWFVKGACARVFI
jgi:hypothetical protein